ncbi:MAG: ComF family protein [Lewinellaceae bacterium]|nr:ComF family protein [Lewinellaceae bacterium]
MKLKNIFHDIAYTIFPNLCIGCGRKPSSRNSHFCVSCAFNVPFTDHFELKTHYVSSHFFGRFKYDFAGSLFVFRERSIVQNMLHNLKYKRKAYIGTALGEMIGDKATESHIFPRPDIIIPIPIHFSKKYHRGYNQSELIASPIAKKLHCEMMNNLLIKEKTTESQTRKSRSERVINVKESFSINDPTQILKQKHVLLVDDVITTGATIEACAQLLYDHGIDTLSVVSAAAAE